MLSSIRCCLALASILTVSLANADGPQVDTPVGSIRGKFSTVEGVQIDEFLGIPFAKPPTGNLRFALPVPYGSVGQLEAVQFGARCPQPEPFKLFENPVPISEDCLTLNIYRKSGTASNDSKPVIAMIHGGAFSMGSGSDFTYQGGPLVAFGDVIVVSLNYRIGVLGFTDVKDLIPGNLGHFDQRLALEWIQDNIGAFGGNPNKVTLMGVSAGSMSVSAQISTPLNNEGRKLFHAAILDGGVIAPGIVEKSEDSLHRIQSIAEKLGCKTEGTEMLECLRKANADELVKLSYDPEENSPVFTFLPTVDGKFLRRDVAEDNRDNAKDFAKVKMLIGTAKDEGTMFAGYYLDLAGKNFPNLTTSDEFVNWCAKLSSGYNYPLNFENKTVRETVATEYYEKNPSRFLDASAFVGDGTFHCPVNSFVRSYSKTNNHVYVYGFERLMKQKLPFFDPEIFGASHASSFLHMTGATLMLSSMMPNITVNADDKAFFVDAIRMVSNFVRSDEPPTFRGVQWPDFSKGEGVLLFNDKPHTSPNLYSEERCRKVFPFFDLSA